MVGLVWNNFVQINTPVILVNFVRLVFWEPWGVGLSPHSFCNHVSSFNFARTLNVLVECVIL